MMLSSSRQLLLSASRKSFALEKGDKGQGKPAIQIIVDGIDMTPRDIMQADQTAVKRNQNNPIAELGMSLGSESLFQQSLYGGPAGASFSQPFSRSVLGSSRSFPECGSDDLAAPSLTDISAVETAGRPPAVSDRSAATDGESTVDIRLTETNTIWLLDMPGTCVALDSDEAVDVQNRNEKYKELCKNRVGNDQYTQRAMQTFENAQKVKHVQTVPVSHNDVGVMATTWDMYDMFEEAAASEVSSVSDEEVDDEAVPERRPGSGLVKGSHRNRSRSLSVPTPSVFSSVSDSRSSVMASGPSSESASLRAGIAMKRQQDVNSPEPSEADQLIIDPILKSDKLKEKLKVMERLVAMNIYQSKQAMYQGLDPIQGNQLASISRPVLERLWTYSCPLTIGKTVCSMAWNKLNNNLLAVGYGQFEYTEQKAGLVCCWSLKNPEYPERVFRTEKGVTALDFSHRNPNLLAVGMYDGMIAFYNVRNSEDMPVLDNSKVEKKHSSPIWQLKWVDKERVAGEERVEVLVSIATDGRVVQWSIGKGCEYNELMLLKRTSKKGRKGLDGSTNRGGKQSEALIARLASGQAFDFLASDTNIYLAGTEEGHIHKCSCSYNEQYLESYFGHTGPVYRILWSPFLPGCFLSCSADWTVRLWHEDQTKPVCTFQSSSKAICDVSWSPRSPGVFACVSDGRVEVWNLAENALDPVIVHEPASRCVQSCLLFALNANAVLVGDCQGQVTVYELRNMSTLPEDKQVEAMNKLLNPTTDSH
jgi:WD40 repeat protein